VAGDQPHRAWTYLEERTGEGTNLDTSTFPAVTSISGRPHGHVGRMWAREGRATAGRRREPGW
jgi:hypothetical protein